MNPWRNDLSHAVTAGTDAQAEVSVRLSEAGKTVTAKGADPDMPVASAKAYLGALNRLMAKPPCAPSRRRCRRLIRIETVIPSTRPGLIRVA